MPRFFSLSMIRLFRKPCENNFRFLQPYLNDVEEFQNEIYLYLDDIEFVDNELTSKWYDGRYPVIWLTIRTDRLHAINAQAFDTPALSDISNLEFRIRSGSVKIHNNAFNGFEYLTVIIFEAPRIEILPMGLFDSVARSIMFIKFYVWPNDVILDEMFNNDPCRNLETLHIQNVDAPQMQFRLLTATNFSTFRRLQELHLINCGIEVIDRHAFDAIGHTLSYINLENNRITFIDFDMFRSFFETKLWEEFSIDNNRVPILCTCQLLELEVVLCPFGTGLRSMCIDCRAQNGVHEAACGIRRDVDMTKFMNKPTDVTMRLVTIRMAYKNNAVVIRTKFTSRFRIIFINVDAIRGAKCTQRASKPNSKCLIIRRFVKHLDLREIDVMHDAKLVSITAIPVLYFHGAKPLHSITVHKVDDVANQRIGSWTLIASVSITMGVVVGFVLGVCACFVSGHGKRTVTKAMASKQGDCERRISYDCYSTAPSVVEENEYEEIVECKDKNSYIDMADVGYLPIH